MDKALIDRLERERTLKLGEYARLIECSGDTARYLRERAVDTRVRVYDRDVYIRGLIEVSNYCRNDCYYCGIRAGNPNVSRYRLSEETILGCCERGYALGFRTFVLQGGEDAYFSDERLCPLIGAIKKRYPGCAVTLSLGERSDESYARLYAAGADRYLLRHETADEAHYARLHPPGLELKKRKERLLSLKRIGFQTGCGMMVGSPYQSVLNLAFDLKFIEELKPQMVGIGPFIPHSDTPFGGFPSGCVETTLKLLSIVRLMLPDVLLPATTALGTLEENGRERGILAGANVVMPNLTPDEEKAKYTLYNKKLICGAEAAAGLERLKSRMEAIGYKIAVGRGDHAGLRKFAGKPGREE